MDIPLPNILIPSKGSGVGGVVGELVLSFRLKSSLAVFVASKTEAFIALVVIAVPNTPVIVAAVVGGVDGTFTFTSWDPLSGSFITALMKLLFVESRVRFGKDSVV